MKQNLLKARLSDNEEKMVQLLISQSRVKTRSALVSQLIDNAWKATEIIENKRAKLEQRKHEIELDLAKLPPKRFKAEG